MARDRRLTLTAVAAVIKRPDHTVRAPTALSSSSEAHPQVLLPTSSACHERRRAAAPTLLVRRPTTRPEQQAKSVAYCQGKSSISIRRVYLNSASPCSASTLLPAAPELTAFKRLGDRPVAHIISHPLATCDLQPATCIFAHTSQRQPIQTPLSVNAIGPRTTCVPCLSTSQPFPGDTAGGLQQEPQTSQLNCGSFGSM